VDDARAVSLVFISLIIGPRLFITPEAPPKFNVNWTIRRSYPPVLPNQSACKARTNRNTGERV
jgi:hypothetical protein